MSKPGNPEKPLLMVVVVIVSLDYSLPASKRL
jgi:hypothetical protein